VETRKILLNLLVNNLTLIKVIGTRNQIIFLLKSAFESFAEKLMRVSKGRPIGASAADKVLDKGRNYSDSNWYVRTTNESNGGVALGSLAFLMCRTSIVGRWRLVSDFLNDGPLSPSVHLIRAPPRLLSVRRFVVLLHGSTLGDFLERSTDAT
jgi:hypothetical protein